MDTFQRICVALGSSTGRQLLDLADPAETFRVSRASARKWQKAQDRTSTANPAGDIAKLSSSKQRWSLGWACEEAGFNGFLDCELYGGSVVSSVIELFERSTIRSFPGEELLYCLRGRVVLEVGGIETALEEGDAVTLWAQTPHFCRPESPVQIGSPPPMILSVRVEKPGR
jgi:hypothetical protein